MFKFFIFFSLINLYIFGGCCNKNNYKNNNICNNENSDNKNKNKNKKDKKEVKNVILLTTGALNPVHKGHINSLKLAQDCLESKGFVVEKLYLSPSSDIYLNSKKNSGKIDHYYNFKNRLKMCQLAVEDFKKENNNEKYKIEVSDWEGKQPCFVDFSGVVNHFEKDINNKDKLVFYICGSDHYKNVKNTNLENVVVIKRDKEIVKLENNKNHFIVEDNDNSDFSSTKAREIITKIKNNENVVDNTKLLEKYLYSSVIGFILKINKES